MGSLDEEKCCGSHCKKFRILKKLLNSLLFFCNFISDCIEIDSCRQIVQNADLHEGKYQVIFFDRFYNSSSSSVDYINSSTTLVENKAALVCAVNTSNFTFSSPSEEIYYQFKDPKFLVDNLNSWVPWYFWFLLLNMFLLMPITFSVDFCTERTRSKRLKGLRKINLALLWDWLIFFGEVLVSRYYTMLNFSGPCIYRYDQSVLNSYDFFTETFEGIYFIVFIAVVFDFFLFFLLNWIYNKFQEDKPNVFWIAFIVYLIYTIIFCACAVGLMKFSHQYMKMQVDNSNELVMKIKAVINADFTVILLNSLTEILHFLWICYVACKNHNYYERTPTSPNTA